MGATLEGRYRIRSVLGWGGMGVVYRARHLRIDCDVAIKIVDVRDRDSSAVERLEREARAVAFIGHENIVTVHDFGKTDEGSAFLVMQLLQGDTVDQRLQTAGRFSLAAACHIGVQVAHALEAAHHLGILHRDIKPANIFLVRERERADVVKLLDFGIAALQAPMRGKRKDRELSGGTVVGTAEYIAPERFAMGIPIDQRADVYSLGATLYEMLSGVTPFRGLNQVDTVMRLLKEDARPLSQIVPRLPLAAQVDELMKDLLARDPDQRLPSMQLVRERLVALRRGLEVPTRRSIETTPGRVTPLRTRLTGWVSTSGGTTTVDLGGALDAHATELHEIAARIEGPEVVFRLSEISHVNSVGFKLWSDWLQGLVARGLRITFHECSTAVIRQANLSHEFLLGLPVVSFQAPFACTVCGLQILRLLQTQDLEAGRPAPAFCEECGALLGLDEVERTYFLFLGRARHPTPAPFVESFESLRDTDDLQRRGATTEDLPPSPR